MSAEISHPLIQITDENDVVVRGGTMDEVQLNGLWHRMTGVMLHDEASDEFLLQKIAPNPYYDGGKWNLTATGHVDNGEEYVQAAKRELQEEMGIVGLNLIDFDYYKTQKQAFRAGKNRVYFRHNRVFIAQVDKDALSVNPDSTEVEEITWMSWNELSGMNSKIATGGLLHFIERTKQGCVE